MGNQAVNTSPADSGKPDLLFVDDDPLIVESLALALERDYVVHTAQNRSQARDLVRKLDRPPSLALVDLGLPPRPHHPDEGFELIGELLNFNPDMKILVLSGQSESANIRLALTLGAVDFVPKPCDVPLLRSRLAHQLMMLAAEQAEVRGEAQGGNLLGESRAIETLRGLIRQFADSPFPVLIQGESGSGKELVARYLHEQSQRSKAPFLSINCAAFPKDLLEAQLFGHARGAFTGAAQNRPGFFEEAGEGGLLLDEIGEMPLELQSKLLRVLENGEYYRLGETQPRLSRARIIAATNRDLREEVRRGAFRADVYHRLGVLTISVPPLRERGDDCLMLLDHFRTLYAAGAAPFRVNDEARDFLRQYSFPGNIRELRNIAIRLGAKYPGQTVSAAQLRDEVETEVYGEDVGSGEADGEIRTELTSRSFSLDIRLQQLEKKYIIEALAVSGGNLSKAARLLGINRTTLYSRMQRLAVPGTER